MYMCVQVDRRFVVCLRDTGSLKSFESKQLIQETEYRCADKAR